MLGLSSMYAYIYCLVVSNELTALPIFGGAMYLCGQVVLEFFGMTVGPTATLLPGKMRKWSRAILALLLLLSLFLIVVYPLQLSSFQLWTVMVIVMAMLGRDEIARRLLHLRAKGALRDVWFGVLLTATHVLPALAVLWDFLVNLPGPRAWSLFAAYGIADALALYSQIRDAVNHRYAAVSPHDVEEMEKIQAQMEKTNAVRQYQALTIAIVVSLISSLVVMYTYLLLAGKNMLLQIGLTVGLTFLTREAADLVFRFWLKHKARRPNPTYVMLLGLLFWFTGLSTFGSAIAGVPLSTLSMYLCLCTSTVGTTLCMTALQWMENAILSVARFTLNGSLSAFQLTRTWNLELGRIIGDMLALVLITIMFSLTGGQPQDIQRLFSGMQPLVLLPTMLTVIFALICTLRFPLSKHYMDKLDRFLHLRNDGVENRALQSQLESIAVAEYRQPFGTAFIKFVIRLCSPHRIEGVENIHLDDDNPLVFLCNHGNIYGPLICASFFPVPMRPWVISQVSTSVDVFEGYFYKYNLQEMKLPEKWKHKLARIAGRFVIWIMRQLEGIPVYRDSPMELIKTFRASVEAMQTGDNLLIFPENPNAIEQDHGYEVTGLGPLFEGFMMLGTIYGKRTHKPCRFLPMYVHKGMHVMRFGQEVVYDPAANAEEERHRVVVACEAEMRRMMEELDEREKQKKESKQKKAGRTKR